MPRHLPLARSSHAPGVYSPYTNRVQNSNPSLVGNGLHQVKLFFGKRIWLGVDKGQDPHHLLTRQQWHTNRGFHTRFVHCIVRSYQQRSSLLVSVRNTFTVMNHPIHQTACLVSRFAEWYVHGFYFHHNGCVHGFTRIIRHDNMHLSPPTFCMASSDVLKNSTQVQRGG